MAKYIDLEAAVDAVTNVYYNTPDINLSADKLEVSLRRIPAADVAPVVHGRWGIVAGTKTRRFCSVCAWDVPEYGKFYAYCPNCGARMDGDADAKAD